VAAGLKAYFDAVSDECRHDRSGDMFDETLNMTWGGSALGITGPIHARRISRDHFIHLSVKAFR
jgi:hypothetical protein